MSDHTETKTYTPPDISCEHCVRAESEEIGQLDGVDSVDVALETKQVTVRSRAVDYAAVRAAIEAAGYEAA